MERRVVITGCGVVSPLGDTRHGSSMPHMSVLTSGSPVDQCVAFTCQPLSLFTMNALTRLASVFFLPLRVTLPLTSPAIQADLPPFDATTLVTLTFEEVSSSV